MNWALLLLLGWTGAAIVAACIVILLVRHRFNRYHRVDRSVATPAPITAAVDPRAAGRLHRRLARAAHTADDIAAQHRPVTRKERRRARHDEPEVVRLATEIKAHAVELDRRIALAARLAPAQRNAELRRLGAAVRELERAVADLAHVSAAARAPSMRPDDRTGLADTRAASATSPTPTASSTGSTPTTASSPPMPRAGRCRHHRRSRPRATRPGACPGCRAVRRRAAPPPAPTRQAPGRPVGSWSWCPPSC